jgi:hypothetical protein
MSSTSLRHHLIAAVGSLLMSSIALGAALAPSQVAAAPLDAKIVTYV